MRQPLAAPGEDGWHERSRRLRAVTIPLERGQLPSLVGLTAAGGRLVAAQDVHLVGLGRALGIALPGGLAALASEAEEDRRAPTPLEVLRRIPSDDQVGLPGCGPVAFGALPFSRESPAELVVPAMIVGTNRAGQAWITTIGSEGSSPAVLRSLGSADAPPSPERFEVRAEQSHAAFRALVARGVDEIRRGQLRKVVVARRVEVRADRPFVTASVLQRLAETYPSCTLISQDGLVGASPELLVRRRGAVVVSHPLAGTVPMEEGGAEHAAALLLRSAKDLAEHQLVVDAVRGALGDLCERVEAPPAEALPLHGLAHLGTRVEGHLRGGAAHGADALAALARLHPTPAVAGTPTDAALAFLSRYEGFHRGRYAGPVGWLDCRGDGEWWLSIRVAEIDGAHARLSAGVGLVEGSDPDQELAETQLKIQAMLGALLRP